MKINSKSDAGSFLSDAEARKFVTMALEGIDVATTEDFEAWVRGSVRSFFPHEMLIAGRVRNDFTEIGIDRLLVVDFPIAYVDAVRRCRGSFACPTLNSWFNHAYDPQLFDPTGETGSSSAWAADFERFELKNVAAHGVVAPDRRSATYFSFSRVPGSLNDRHAYLLELVVPHLHQAYIRVVANYSAIADLSPLSDDEITLLHWISIGKSDADISVILNRTVHSVKHAVRGLLSKLKVTSRQEALEQAAWLHPTGIRKGG
jgi:LuxR family transcriptional regulator, quorum-sensing system regulator CviR